jgi:hypothetical protein
MCICVLVLLCDFRRSCLLGITYITSGIVCNNKSQIEVQHLNLAKLTEVISHHVDVTSCAILSISIVETVICNENSLFTQHTEDELTTMVQDYIATHLLDLRL